MNLTPKEQSLLSYIETYQLEHGSSPTVREMREEMGLKSDGFIVHCLRQLVKKGAIEKDDTPRGIKLVQSVAEKLQKNFVKLPVLGSIPAGGPVLTEEFVENWMSFEEGSIKNPKDCFILRVRGESMIDAGIYEGDYVIASSKQQPRNGDVVIALVDGGSTVKRYVIEGGRAYLKAENKKYSNIYPATQLEVQGVVVGLFRWY